MFFHDDDFNQLPPPRERRGLFWEFVSPLLGLNPPPSYDYVDPQLEKMRRREEQMRELNQMAAANLPPRPSVAEVVRDVVAEVIDAIAPGRASALDTAKAWLLATLATGPISATALDHLAAEAGIAARTLQRARRKLGLTPRRINGRSFWMLPEHDVRQDRHPHGGEDAT